MWVSPGFNTLEPIKVLALGATSFVFVTKVVVVLEASLLAPVNV